MPIGTYLSITVLNENGLNTPTKKHRLAEWIQKQDLYIHCLQEIHFRPNDTYIMTHIDWKWEDWKIYSIYNSKQKKPGVPILILNKIDLKTEHFKW